MRRKMVINKGPKSMIRLRASLLTDGPAQLPKATDLSWISNLHLRWSNPPDELLWLAS
jgi:hypothetical protein